MKRMAYTFGVTADQLRDGRTMRIIKEYLRHMLARTVPAGAKWRVRHVKQEVGERKREVYILVFNWEEADDG